MAAPAEFPPTPSRCVSMPHSSACARRSARAATASRTGAGNGCSGASRYSSEMSCTPERRARSAHTRSLRISSIVPSVHPPPCSHSIVGCGPAAADDRKRRARSGPSAPASIRSSTRTPSGAGSVNSTARMSLTSLAARRRARDPAGPASGSAAVSSAVRRSQASTGSSSGGRSSPRSIIGRSPRVGHPPSAGCAARRSADGARHRLRGRDRCIPAIRASGR
ncbi:hypothetical protein SRABI44_00992 [Microbacterium foliorum]|nr:hypothetical protein SRABI03_00409 [Microbacterium foliorum]CAH0162234.1 hypothetical protein SRABI44_00992 [Microbacterium foliorum]